MAPKFSIKDFVLLNDLSMMVVGRIFNPNVNGWQYNLKSTDNTYIKIPETLIQEKKQAYCANDIRMRKSFIINPKKIKIMKKAIKKVIETYQCPGCISGCDISCYEKNEYSVACKNHRAGTLISGIGKIFSGMPKGFNRLGCGFGNGENLKIYIFESVQEQKYDKFNIPVWKYLDENGNTLVRGISPRINAPFLHVFIGNEAMNRVKCFEVSEEMIEEMD